MLAIVGWVFPELVGHLPAETYSATNPLAAVGQVGFLPNVQIFLFMMLCEGATYEKVYEKNCEDPGNYGFDPFGLAKDPKRKAHYQLAEIKNGRLAMVAIGGAIHHALLTNQGMIEQLTSQNFCKLSSLFFCFSSPFNFFFFNSNPILILICLYRIVIFLLQSVDTMCIKGMVT